MMQNAICGIKIDGELYEKKWISCFLSLIERLIFAIEIYCVKANVIYSCGRLKVLLIAFHALLEMLSKARLN